MNEGLREALFELDCASLADADKAIRVCDAGLRPLNPGHKLVGPARTVRCHEDFLGVIQALEQAHPGEVLVVDTQGGRRAVLGELFSLEAQRRGLAGIVVDGLVRDTRTLVGLSLPVYARGACPCAGTTSKLTTTQVAVTCGGVVIEPGDIVVGDRDGLIVASAETFAALVPIARDIEDKERALRERLADGRGLVTMLNLNEHYAALERGEASRLRFVFDD